MGMKITARLLLLLVLENKNFLKIQSLTYLSGEALSLSKTTWKEVLSKVAVGLSFPSNKC